MQAVPIKPEKRPQYTTPKEYAAERGVHVNTVLNWLREKRIPGEQPGGRRGVWLIPVEGK